MAAPDANTSNPDMEPAFTCRWRWLLTLGIIQLLAGAAAIAVPPIATAIAAATIAWLLVIAAVFHVVHAFGVRAWRGFALHFVSGALYLLAGVLILLNPWPGVMGLTLVLAGLLIADGVLRGVLAFRVRPRDGWGWFLAGGVASVILGALILMSWPEISMWAIGLLVGVHFVFSGAMNVPLALACRSRQRQAESSGSLASAH